MNPSCFVADHDWNSWDLVLDDSDDEEILSSIRTRYYAIIFPNLSSRLLRYRQRVANEVFDDTFFHRYRTLRGDLPPNTPSPSSKSRRRSSHATVSRSAYLDSLIATRPPDSPNASRNSLFSQIGLLCGMPSALIPKYTPNVTLAELSMRLKLILDRLPSVVTFPYPDEVHFNSLFGENHRKKERTRLHINRLFREVFQCGSAELPYEEMIPSLFGDVVGLALRRAEMEKVREERIGSMGGPEDLDIAEGGGKELMVMMGNGGERRRVGGRRIKKKGRRRRRRGILRNRRIPNSIFQLILEFIGCGRKRIMKETESIHQRISKTQLESFNSDSWKPLSLVSQSWRRSVLRSFHHFRLDRRNCCFIPLRILLVVPSLTIDFHRSSSGFAPPRQVIFSTLRFLHHVHSLFFIGSQSLLQLLHMYHDFAKVRTPLPSVRYLSILDPHEPEIEGIKSTKIRRRKELEVLGQGVIGLERMVLPMSTSALGLPPVFPDAWKFVGGEDSVETCRGAIRLGRSLLSSMFPNVESIRYVPIEFCGLWRKLTEVEMLESEWVSSELSLPLCVERVKISFNLMWSEREFPGLQGTPTLTTPNSACSSTYRALHKLEEWIALKPIPLDFFCLEMRSTYFARSTDFSQTPLGRIRNLRIDGGKRGCDFTNVACLDDYPRCKLSVFNLPSVRVATSFLGLKNVETIRVDVLRTLEGSILKYRDPAPFALALNVKPSWPTIQTKRVTIRDCRSARIHEPNEGAKLYPGLVTFSSCVIYEAFVTASSLDVSVDWLYSRRFVESMLFHDVITLEEFDVLAAEYPGLLEISGEKSLVADIGAQEFLASLVQLVQIRPLETPFSLTLFTPREYTTPILQRLGKDCCDPFYLDDDESFVEKLWQTPWMNVFFEDLSTVVGPIPDPAVTISALPSRSFHTGGKIARRYDFFLESRKPSLFPYDQRLKALTFLKQEANEYLLKSLEKLSKRRYSSILDLLDKWPIEGAEFDSLRVASDLNRSLCCFRLGEYDECLVHCESILSTDPNCIKAIFRAGFAHLKLGDVREAMRCGKRALGLDRNNRSAKKLLAMVAKERLKQVGNEDEDS